MAGSHLGTVLTWAVFLLSICDLPGPWKHGSLRLSLDLRFLTGGNCAPLKDTGNIWDVFGCHNWGVLLASSGSS